jgi:hypothetical protein
MYLLYSSWLRWPDAGVDFGYFLYNAWQLSEGATFGGDFHYYYGPLALTGYSLLFKVFGPSIVLVYAVNFLLLACTTFLIHQFFRNFSKSIAALATLSFLGVFALGQYIFQANYTFLAPYKPEISVGTPLLLLTAHLFLALGRRTSPRLLLGGGFCTGLLLLTSTELALAALGIFFVFLCSTNIFKKENGFLFLGLIIAPVISLAFFSLIQPVPNPWITTWRTFEVLTHNSLLFADSLKELMGLDRPWLRLTIILQVFSFFTLVGLLFVILGKNFKVKFLWACVFFPVGAMVFANAQISYWLFFPKMLPIFPILGLLWWLGNRKNRLLYGIWSILALILLARIMGNAMFHYYGFSLAFPAYLLLFPLICQVAPTVWNRFFPSSHGFAPFAVATAICTLTCALTIRQPFFAHKDFAVTAGKDLLFDWTPNFSPRGLAMKALLADLLARKTNEPILGLPDGHMINYLTRTPRPRPFSLSLGELMEFGEAKILQSYQEAKPQFIFVSEPEDYDDKNGFGQKYGQSILAWVKSEYRFVQTYGVPVKFSLYERK